MRQDYLSVKDFGELAGVSVQSIYAKINNLKHPIQQYLKIIDGKKYISRAAYYDLYGGEYAAEDITELQEDIKQEQQPEQPKEKESIDRLLDILEMQLEEQRRQLQEKDKQIESLLKRLEETSQLKNQQQQLTALNHKTLTDQKEEEIDLPLQDEKPLQQENKSLWNRIRGFIYGEK